MKGLEEVGSGIDLKSRYSKTRKKRDTVNSTREILLSLGDADNTECVVQDLMERIIKS
jgi:hypothetical protein